MFNFELRKLRLNLYFFNNHRIIIIFLEIIISISRRTTRNNKSNLTWKSSINYFNLLRKPV